MSSVYQPKNKELAKVKVVSTQVNSTNVNAKELNLIIRDLGR